LTQGVARLFYRTIVRLGSETVVNLVDMTEMLRPFFWLMVGLAGLAPAAILVARRCALPVLG